jgi:hypothetical protein
MFFPQRLRLALAALLAASLAGGGAVAPPAEAKGKAPEPEGARLTGRVFESDGATPAQGVVVRVHPLEAASVIASAPTDDKGRFEIEGLAHGYVDLTVERDGALFAGAEVVGLPPRGKVAVDLTLTRLDERSAAWWATRGPLQLPGGQGQAAGIAEVRPELGGRDFWKSKKGIAVLASVGGAALLAIAIGSRNSPSDRP